MIKKNKNKKILFPPECRRGTGSGWARWQPRSQPGPAPASLGLPGPSGGTARRTRPRPLWQADTRGRSPPGCRSWQITGGGGEGHCQGASAEKRRRREGPAGEFKSCISLEDVEGHHHGDAEQVGDLDLLPEVAEATAFDEAQVLQEEKKKQ